MRRSIILALLGFVLVLIVRFPARWISPLLPHGMHCGQLDGSAWSGSCTGLMAGNGFLGDLTWDLRGLQLLRGRLDLQLDLTNQSNYVRGDVAFGFGGAVHGRDVSVDLPLNSQASLLAPRRAFARTCWANLRASSGPGSFCPNCKASWMFRIWSARKARPWATTRRSLRPDAAGSADLPVGVVHDTGGPLALDATLQLNHDPGYVLQGQVAARPSASPDIAERSNIWDHRMHWGAGRSRIKGLLAFSRSSTAECAGR